MQVRALEVVDRTVGQIIRRLWEVESRQFPAPSAAITGCAKAKAVSCIGSSALASGAGICDDGAADIDADLPHFTLVITGGNTTPVMSGGRSHEPVPFAIAHLRHVVRG